MFGPPSELLLFDKIDSLPDVLIPYNCSRHYDILLAPSGALIVMMVYYISAAAATFSDFEHSSLSIMLQVSF